MKDNQVLIIAEAVVNHNGSLELAKQLALEAKRAGADIYHIWKRLQLFNLWTDDAKKEVL